MSYFFLDCFPYKKPLRDIDYTNPIIRDFKATDFNDGKRFDIGSNESARFELFDKGDMPEFFKVPTLVMRPDFAKALTDYGLDNIQMFPAVLKDPHTGEVFDYLLGNILTVIDVIDQQKSERHGKTGLYNKIVIDQSLAGKCPLFRPMHKSSSIMVTEELKNHLETYSQFSNTYYVTPEKYL